MVIDTSAIFAAIAGEPDSATYRATIKSASIRLISAVTLLETRAQVLQIELFPKSRHFLIGCVTLPPFVEVALSPANFVHLFLVEPMGNFCLLVHGGHTP